MQMCSNEINENDSYTTVSAIQLHTHTHTHTHTPGVYEVNIHNTVWYLAWVLLVLLYQERYGLSWY